MEKDSSEDEMILSEITVANLLKKCVWTSSKIEFLCKGGLDLDQFCIFER